MDKKWHINPHTREVNPCVAEIKCNFGENTTHYSTVQAAISANEKELEEYVIPPSLRRNIDDEIRTGNLTRESYTVLKKQFGDFVQEERSAGAILNDAIANRDTFLNLSEKNDTLNDLKVKEREKRYNGEISEAYENLEATTANRRDFLSAHQAPMVKYQQLVDPGSKHSNRLSV